MDRDELLAGLLRGLGFFGLPREEEERWRCRWVGNDGQVIAALLEDGRLVLELEHRRQRGPLPSVVVGTDVPVPAARIVVQAAMAEVRRCSSV